VRIEDIMTRNVVTADMDNTLRQVKTIFDNVTFHHLLVLDKGKLTGVISDRDLLKEVSPGILQGKESAQELQRMKKHVHMIMSRKPVTLNKEASVKQAIELIVQENVSCIPVVDSENHVEGIVTWRDVLKHFLALSARREQAQQSQQ
jgi:acetoin utilization protein AcuB